MNLTGNYFNSKYKNSRCRSFGKAIRDISKNSFVNPGPGNYILPSEFGIYESSTVEHA